ncbi:GNAT family N-acetyltransferase [bacterium]|nr:GNAT family N-acetyltransferase [bacterium]
MLNDLNTKIVDYKNHHFQIHQVRNEVFIDEQKVPENIEIDGWDSDAIHALAFDGDKTIGTGRLLPDGHIGRIAVKKQYRGRGIGKSIMKKLIREAIDLHLSEVWLSSQYQARNFYQKLGFIEAGDIYQEANIDHIKMKKNLSRITRIAGSIEE